MKKENYAVIKNGVVTTLAGKNVTNQVKASVLKRAQEAGEVIMWLNDNGDWNREKYLADDIIRQVAIVYKSVETPEVENKKVVVENPIMNMINTAVDQKPLDLFCTDLKWKFLTRSVLRGKSIMMTGGAGSGKTFTAQQVAVGLNRPFFYFNLGATQDPRSTLIGNTHFKEGVGTMFNASLFVQAIQTEGAVILLDELSRANPEAWNILMTVLDEGQRYLRLDEQEGAPTIKVHPSVAFIATANIGNEFTATRVMDRALLDRFVIVEVDALTVDSEIALLTNKFPELRSAAIEAIANIADMSRKELLTDSPKITTCISTRSTLELAGLMYDGFKLAEAAEVAIYPFYDKEGGMDSERTFMKQIVQKYATIDDENVSVGQEITPEYFDIEL